MHSRFAFLVLTLSTLVTGRADAETAVTLVTLHSTELELVERTASTTAITFKILAKVSVADVKLRSWSISQEGRLIERGASKVDFGKAADGTPELSGSLDLSKLNASGRYQLTLEFFGPAPLPTPAVPKPTEPEQTMQLKLNRPAAELRISTPLRFERTIHLPSIGPFERAWTLKPETITLTEANGKTWVKIRPNVWHVVLRHGDDAPEEHRLRIQLPDSVDGWGQAEAKVALDGPVSIGTTTGTLTIRAPQLAAQTVDFAVTLVSRVASWWLFPVIILGILLGWGFRNRLEARRARLAAIVPAEQELAVLDDLINATADPTHRGSMERLRDTLVGKIEDEAGTPETITAATTKAAIDREAAVKTMTDLRAKLHASLQTWSRPGTIKAPLPDDTAPILEELRAAVDRLTKMLEDGSLTDVNDQVTTALPELARRLREALREWLRQCNELKVTPPQPWANTPLAAKLANLTADADKLTQDLDTDTPEALWNALIKAATLLAHCKQELFGTVRDRAVETASAASATVRKFGAALEPKASVIDAAGAAMPSESIAGQRTAATAFTHHMNALRKAIIDGLTAAWNDPAATLPGLDQGDFVQALAALEAKIPPAEGHLGDEDVIAAPDAGIDLAAALARIPARTATAIVPKWTIILQAASATVDDPVTVQARLIVPLGGDQPDVTLSWFKAGIPAGRSAPGTFERSFIFTQPGLVSVSVVALDSTGASVFAELIVRVRAVHGARAVEATRETLANVEHILTVASGAIITVAGWFIFSPTFIGTFAEIFAAFLWGFSADVGAAKVRELTDSVKGLKVPIPLPKQS